MTANPIFYQFFLPSIFDSWNNPDITKVDPSGNRLIWQLRPKLGCVYYVCMHALEQGAREEDCSTPLFRSQNIPDYVLDYMDHYANAMQVGAAWYRQNRRQK